MPDAYESLVIGIVGGILTTVLLFIVSRFFHSVIIPWYQGVIYKGASVSGIWEEEIDFGSGNKQTARISLTQKAHNVTGTIATIKTTDGDVIQSDTFNLNGRLQDRIFHGVAVPDDKHRVGRVVVLLELIGEGHKLYGSVSWYDARASMVVNNKTQWLRK